MGSPEHIETRYRAYRRHPHGWRVASSVWKKCPKSWRRLGGGVLDWPGCRAIHQGDAPPGCATRAEAIADAISGAYVHIRKLEVDTINQRQSINSLHALLPEMEALDAKDEENDEDHN